MKENLPDFPALFDRIGHFLTQFDALRKERLTLSPDAFAAKFDNFVKGNSPSGAEEALAAFNEIVETVYVASARACPSGSTRMRA
jgi:hypothetical protein